MSPARLRLAALVSLAAPSRCTIAKGDSCSALVDASGNPISQASWAGGATTECATGWCLSQTLIVDEPVCGSIGSNGDGCNSDADCYDGQFFTLVCSAAGQCAIPTGQSCNDVEDSAGEAVRDQTNYGGATEACETGWCLHDFVLQTALPLCGSIASYGEGCTTDADCFQTPADEDSTFAFVCTAAKQCAIPTGQPCSGLNADEEGNNLCYEITPLGGACPGCATGWCLSDSVVRGEPVCGSIGSNGQGCSADSDCYPSLTCSSGLCKFPGGSCAVFHAYKQWKEEVNAAGACPQPATGGTDDQGRKTCSTQVDGRAWYMVLD